MFRKGELPELLAPAGSADAFYAAVAAGADAIYVGIPEFNARRFSEAFSEEVLSNLVTYAHLFGRRVYATLNTLITDRERDAFLEAAGVAYRVGVDAVIVADLGAARLLRRHFPALVLHASTQMSVHSVLGAEALRSLGVTRVVPARELSLTDIRAMVERSSCEIEVFLHGALCVSHSGQCLFSSLVGGRSGNRGECAQPCRLPYSGGYPLSLRDLSLASHVTELLSSGVSSLKIEGRMKSAAYVYTTVSLYRRLLDERRNATEGEVELLRSVFSRGGFTDGYFTGKHTRPMTGVRSESDKSETRSVTVLDRDIKSCPIEMAVCLTEGRPLSVTLTTDRFTVTACGALPLPAQNRPLTEEGLLRQMTKLGGTPFSLKGTPRVTLDGGLYLSPAELNLVRRAAVEKLLSLYREPLDGRNETAAYEARAASDTWAPTGGLPSVYCYQPDTLSAVPEGYERYAPLFRLSECKVTPEGVALPPVIPDSEEGAVRAMLGEAVSRGIRLCLCGNLGHFALAREYGMTPVGDFRLNIQNRESAAFYASLGVRDSVLSPELTPPQARDIGGRVIVYGHVPLMLLERCFIKENFSCKACGGAAFTDRRGARFPLLREYPHRNLLLNHLPTYMGDRKGELSRSLLPHFIFTVESAREVAAVLRAYERGEALPHPVRRMGKRGG